MFSVLFTLLRSSSIVSHLPCLTTLSLNFFHTSFPRFCWCTYPQEIKQVFVWLHFFVVYHEVPLDLKDMFCSHLKCLFRFSCLHSCSRDDSARRLHRLGLCRQSTTAARLCGTCTNNRNRHALKVHLTCFAKHPLRSPLICKTCAP